MSGVEVWSKRLVVLACGVLAAIHFAITVSTLLSYTLRHPLHDQFRLNLRYLTEPFPLSVLLLENGHRPILPGMARVAELRWLDGQQWIQIATAWGLAIGGTIVLIREMGRSWPPLQTSAVAALTVMFVWWNAHARMFIHAYEAVHLFYILGMLVLSIMVLHAASSKNWPGWWHLSWMACVFASFSFGPGIATFAALGFIAVRHRMPRRLLVVIAVSALTTLCVYLYVLPGAEGVRNASGGISVTAAVFHVLARLGAPAHEILRVLPFAAEVPVLAASLAGLIVFTVCLTCIFRARRESSSPTLIGSLGEGLLIFGLCANTLIALNRTDYFLRHPDQLFADRYLFWASMAWLGASIWMTDWLHAAGKRQWLTALGAPVLLGAGLPAAVWLSGWSAEVYRHVELAAVGMQIGVAPDEQIAAISDAGVPVARRAVEEMLKARHSGYSTLPSSAEAARWSVQSDSLPEVTLVTGSNGREITGRLDERHAPGLRGRWLWLVDVQGRAIGLVTPTRSLTGIRNPLRFGIPVLDGIEGYWMSSPGPASWLAVQDGPDLRPVARVRLAMTVRASQR